MNQSSAMAAKRNRDDEPCVAAVVHACPAATLNPQTKKPFCDKTIRGVFTTECYDFDPEHPWKFQLGSQKVYLPQQVKDHRLDMARYILRYGQASAWWAQHVVWFDPCASIIPGTQKQYDQMRQACKGRKRYISDNAKLYSPNLQGPPTALKQRQWEGTKVNWFMVLARGVTHVEVMPSDWALNGKGLALFADRLPAILHRMLGIDARIPRHAFTDRGTGMYNPVGKVVHEYADAMERAGSVCTGGLTPRGSPPIWGTFSCTRQRWHGSASACGRKGRKFHRGRRRWSSGDGARAVLWPR